MSLYRFADDGQLEPQDTAMPQLQNSMGGTSKMLPFNVFTAGASEASPLLDETPPLPSPHVSFLHLRHSPSGPIPVPSPTLSLAKYSSMSPPHKVINNSLDSGASKYVHSVPDLKSPEEYNPQHSAQALWPNFSPGYPYIPVKKQSRLPPDDVGRKVPRKSIASTSVTNSASRPSISKPIPTPRRTAKEVHRFKRNSAVPVRQSTPARQCDTLEFSLFAPRASPLNDHQRLPPTSIRSQAVALDNDVEVDDANEADIPRLTMERCIGSSSTSVPTKESSDKNIICQARPRGHPWYRYPIPKKLEGLHRALGKENWSDYLLVTEKRLLGEITEKQFVSKTRHIFLTSNESTRRRMDNLMVRTVVMPVLKRRTEGRDRNVEEIPPVFSSSN
jgi:hypothetical protein